MTQVLEFVVLVVVVSASGVMAPGPLFVASISYGLKGGMRAGLKMAVGHAIVEFPIVIILGIGAVSLESFSEYRVVISILGAAFLFVFAGMQIRALFGNGGNFVTDSRRSPLVAGMALSGLNPFFIIWWITIGFKLISDALLIWAFGGMDGFCLAGHCRTSCIKRGKDTFKPKFEDNCVLVLFALHIWMDFAWLGIVAHLASKGAKILSSRSLKIIVFGLSLALVYFGVNMLFSVSQ